MRMANKYKGCVNFLDLIELTTIERKTRIVIGNPKATSNWIRHPRMRDRYTRYLGS